MIIRREFTIVEFEECPKGEVHLIPIKFKCRICQSDAFSSDSPGKVVCIGPGEHFTNLSDYSRQFGVIKGVTFDGSN